MIRATIGVAIGAFLISGAAEAATVTPVSYSMKNGELGKFVYEDRPYWPAPSGENGNSLALLSGGRGKLTDGVTTGENWDAVSNMSGTGPYVGWETIDPVITFSFDKSYNFTSVTFYVDDSNGNGGVLPPAKVIISPGQQSEQTYNVTDPASSLPFAFTVALAATIATDTLSVQLFRNSTTVPWIMLSEVTFEADLNPVPLPAALPLFASGLAGMGLVGWRRKRKAASVVS